MRKALNLKPKEINNYLNNPFLKTTDDYCRKIERHLNKPRGWMEQQHVEMDGLRVYFPEDVRELLSIYSNPELSGRTMLLEIASSVQVHLMDK